MHGAYWNTEKSLEVVITFDYEHERLSSPDGKHELVVCPSCKRCNWHLPGQDSLLCDECLIAEEFGQEANREWSSQTDWSRNLLNEQDNR